jgi:NAD(P)H-dependent FMN reductase
LLRQVHATRRTVRALIIRNHPERIQAMRQSLMILSALSLALPSLTVSMPAAAKTVYKEWVGKNGKHYCRRSDGTIGLIAGGVAGVLVGRSIDTRGDRTLGTLGGAALGALAGREVDRRVSRRRCR